MAKALNWFKGWLSEERSAAEISGTVMMMLFVIIIAIGIGWLASKYISQSGKSVLQRMTDTASQGVDPNTPPDVVEGWE